MGENDNDQYIGIKQPDGGIQMNGPVSSENAQKLLRQETELPVISTHAKNPGTAMLKILTTVINSEKSK